MLIGITPGMRQARMALETLRDRLRAKASIEDAARAAKMAASFEGSMRTVAARLMDRFKLHEVFGLRSCADLFGQAASRAHYTSVLRYPVLQRKARSGAWTNYSGGSEVSKHPDMRKMLNELFLPGDPSASRTRGLCPSDRSRLLYWRVSRGRDLSGATVFWRE